MSLMWLEHTKMKREGYDVNNKHLDNQFMALGGDNDSEERSLRNFERLTIGVLVESRMSAFREARQRKQTAAEPTEAPAKAMSTHDEC